MHRKWSATELVVRLGVGFGGEERREEEKRRKDRNDLWFVYLFPGWGTLCVL